MSRRSSRRRSGGRRVAPQRRPSASDTPTEAVGPRTARNTRQELKTGTVTDVLALTPEQPDTSDLALDTPERTASKFTDRSVEQSIEFIHYTGIADYITSRRDATKLKPGRPSLFTAQAILVAMRLATRDSRPLLLTELRDILLTRLQPTMQRMLDIKPDPRPRSPLEGRMWDQRTAAAVRRAFHRLLDTIDPSVLPKNRKRTWEEIEGLKRDLTIEQQEERVIALDWVCNQLLEASYHQMPPKVRARADKHKPGYGIDGTPLKLFARGRKVDSKDASVDPDGGYYYREGDHRDPDEQGGPGKRTTKKLWAREIHLLVLADHTHPDRLYHPAIPLALTTDRPAVDPSGASRRVFANLHQRGHRPGWLAGDNLYTGQDKTRFQIPAREAGHDLVLGYRADQTGNQGAHTSGMLLVEGGYHAPCIPDDLIDATTAYREKRITHAEFKARISARLEYRMRTKETPKLGTNERLTCPAAGPHPTAICALKPTSENPRPIRQSDGALVDVRRRIDHTKVVHDNTPPKVCQQESVTVTIEDGAKYRQPLPYGSPDHSDLYTRLRQSQEGVHGTAKDDAGAALDNPGRRRVHGWAAQQLFAAFLLAETAARRITAFLRDHEVDENGDMYVPRRVDRTGPATPPGAASPDRAPPVAA